MGIWCLGPDLCRILPLASGKRLHNYGKIQSFLMGKSTFYRLGHGFNSYMCISLPEGIIYINPIINHYSPTIIH